MSKGRGKLFEQQVKEALERARPEAYIKRNTDAMTGKGKHSVPSPPDLEMVARDMALLVECKARKSTSIPFKDLAEHQLSHLDRWDKVRPGYTFGAVAVLAYNGLLGRGRMYNAWLIPIDEWISLDVALKRKSLPIAPGTTNYIDIYRMEWVPGTGFDAAPALEQLLRPMTGVDYPNN